jgi:low temperature requirement protein LtrA
LGNYFLRILMLWSIWHKVSTTVNFASTQYITKLNSQEVEGADRWLGWVETATLVVSTSCVTLMANAAVIDNSTLYYGYWCLAHAVAFVDKDYQVRNASKEPTSKGRMYLVLQAGSALVLSVISFMGFVSLTRVAIWSVTATVVVYLGFTAYSARYHDHTTNSSEPTSNSIRNSVEQSAFRIGAFVESLNKEHLEERYGLLTILLLGEGVGVASFALPKGSGAIPTALALLSFFAAALGWLQYFSSAPRGFRRLPVAASGGSFTAVVFVIYHIGLLITFPLISVAFARVVEHSASETGDFGAATDLEPYDVMKTKLLLVVSTASFMVLSGGLVALGEDSIQEARSLSPLDRGKVRAGIGAMLCFFGAITCISTSEPWRVEIWAPIITLSQILSIYIETRPKYADISRKTAYSETLLSSEIGTKMEAFVDEEA